MGTKKIPMRMCTGCREMKPKKELIRLVKTPEGEIKLDPIGKMNGRGAYFCKAAECLQKAKKTGALARAFEMQVPEEVFAAAEKELAALE